MTDVMIKPLRTYEDRGEIRRRNSQPYLAPAWLAKELKIKGFCEVVQGESAVAALDLSIKNLSRGKWVVVDSSGEPVGDFSGTKEEASAELERLIAASGESESPDLPSKGEGVSESPVPPEPADKE
ncbi:hypothetical protein K5D38_05080 [Pseudomonas cichorii]|nr:hypothetical protein [Pseudomonas cichorii]MBX8474146.1 hypothetical protein [Pseudomonas cichorii]GFM48969.1 hypothetical protein PSCICE_02360 [Pseudomonas cichorii]